MTIPVWQMWTGLGVGKGLNIKGKSAKRGALSGYVPFLQISQTDHKRAVARGPSTARTRIFFRSAEQREEAFLQLERVMHDMKAALRAADARLGIPSSDAAALPIRRGTHHASGRESSRIPLRTSTRARISRNVHQERTSSRGGAAAQATSTRRSSTLSLPARLKRMGTATGGMAVAATVASGAVVSATGARLKRTGTTAGGLAVTATVASGAAVSATVASTAATSATMASTASATAKALVTPFVPQLTSSASGMSLPNSSPIGRRRRATNIATSHARNVQQEKAAKILQARLRGKHARKSITALHAEAATAQARRLHELERDPDAPVFAGLFGRPQAPQPVEDQPATLSSDDARDIRRRFYMRDPHVRKIDDYADSGSWGIDAPERVRLHTAGIKPKSTLYSKLHLCSTRV